MTLTVELSHDEALVLFEWLAAHRDRRTADDPDMESITAEGIAFSQLEAQLETRLPEIFSADYAERLDAAKSRLLKQVIGD
ncbi:hypothetical protein [Asticcacaulis biprosthecium]|nr:hypothetical protein [Asticcacaulis biprosthecium]